MWHEWWLAEQLLFDLFNEKLGGRYKTELKDRCYSPEASRPGQSLQEYVAMLKQLSIASERELKACAP